MVNITKGSVVFKHTPKDFIVEELWDNYTCKVSEDISALSNYKINLDNLDAQGERDFLSCEMEKLNIDHFTAMSILSTELKNQAHELGFAGTKDKLAWTCQKISIFNPKADKILSFSHPNVFIKNFKWIRHKIKVGDLIGNKFKITLRDVDSDAIKVLSRVRNTEFIPNFFGTQRFGSLRGDNVKIGKLILQKRFKDAVLALLSGFGDKEDDEVKRAKIKFRAEKDIVKAKEYFPNNLLMEHTIIEHLSKSDSKEDWTGALNTLDKKILLIMCQAVQSHLFNEILMRAIEEGLDLYNSVIPLPGFDSKFPPAGNLGRIEQEVLKANSLDLRDFNVKAIPTLSLSSSPRKAFFKVRDLKAETQDDELFPHSKKIILSFVLDSGVYATTLLENFFILR
jgi:tRNA pseudouridine13 synthase